MIGVFIKNVKKIEVVRKIIKYREKFCHGNK